MSGLASPRKGNKSAPSDRPHSDAKVDLSGRSNPETHQSNTPSMSPRTGGSGDIPTSVKSNVVNPPGPRRTGKSTSNARNS